ncbi:MAG: helix-turn-helix transcriptional regulator [Candidatus Peregrinibacteria bacterium]|nr:helix-turn-helix transcriptional regulator [Candidatus Peregrinibacteria bacterium]MCB9807805.1 helix-turn-helix transcriptional regulator [Candidatus Peribacteria bacterium]
MAYACISQRLRDLRTQQGLSQRALANSAGVYHPTVCLIEQGRQIPTLPTIRKLAHALNVDISTLVT